jgi:hypothetical protein
MSLSVNKSKVTSLFGTESSLTALTTTYQRSSRVRLVQARRVQVFVAYNAAAVGGLVSIFPVGSGKDGQDVDPAADVWFPIGVWDGSVSPAAGSGTLASGTDFTITQSFGRTTVYPQELRSPAALNAADKVRLTFSIDVGGVKWLGFDVAEMGGGAAGSLHLAVLPYA